MLITEYLGKKQKNKMIILITWSFLPAFKNEYVDFFFLKDIYLRETDREGKRRKGAGAGEGQRERERAGVLISQP